MNDTQTTPTIGTQFAVNIADMTKYADDYFHPVNLMLRPLLKPTNPKVEAEKTMDGIALLISPDTTVERWEAVVQIIREGLGMKKGVDKSQMRIYKFMGKGEPPRSSKPGFGSIYVGRWERI